MKTFTLLSDELGGIATLHEAAKACGGENISPQLRWVNAPKDTKSFAVTIHDQSAPTQSGFWHWVLFNIPVYVDVLHADDGNPRLNTLPVDCVQGKNDYGTYGYGGVNPPMGHGFHLYLITVYALDIKQLDLNKDTPAAQVVFNLWQHCIEKASMVMYYKR